MDNPEQLEPYERTHEYVEALLHGRRPEPWPDVSPKDAEILRMAGVLNGVGGAAHPRAQFVADLAAELERLSESPPRRFWRFSRRTLLRGIAGVAGVFVAGAAVDRGVSMLGQANPGTGWVAVARAAEVAPGAAKRFLANGVEGYVLNIEGRFSALSALCTHLPCVLSWSGPEQQFVCPCHQAEFTTTGQWRPSADYDHPLSSLPILPIKERGGMLYVYPGDSADQGAQEDDQEHKRP
ncbi:MAG TPA: Rieske 2Fe-2S domain-containing protein [Chloroflexota bacterium]|nr:Rieske 2Fe-2S domain-containing protein [Chloroflexota bacterium]